MQISMKRTIYLGLAALGFVTVVGATNATSVSAMSYAKPKLTKNLDKNVNVALNGNNALYTREGTFKGAKKVASTTTLKKLNQSKHGQDNWLAYRYTITDRGSVYYKVVSFDKAYRGWVYGGKAANKFAGGLSTYTTLKATDTISDTNKGNFKFATPGKTNDGTSLTYKDPMWTKMGSGRVIKDSSKFTDDVLTITKQGIRTRENDEWVFVEDEANPTINGWVMRKGLVANDKISASQGVTINFIDKDSGKKVGSQLIAWAPKTATDTTMDVTGTKVELTPGYSADATPWTNSANTATKGSSVNYYVNQNAKTTAISMDLRVAANDDGSFGPKGAGFTSKTDLWGMLTTAQQDPYVANYQKAQYQVVTGTTMAATNVKNLLTDSKLNSFEFVNKADGKTYVATYKSASKLEVVKNNLTPRVVAYFTVAAK